MEGVECMRQGTKSPVRILIAEDESIIRLDLREMLVQAGYEVCAEAAGGEEAVRMAQETEPEAAVLDVRMPCLLYTSPSPRDRQKSRMPSSA